MLLIGDSAVASATNWRWVIAAFRALKCTAKFTCRYAAKYPCTEVHG